MANPEIRVRRQRTSDSSSPPSSSGGSSPAYACAVARARGALLGQRSFGGASLCVAHRGNCGNWPPSRVSGDSVSRSRFQTYVFIRHDLVGGGGISLRSARAGHFEGRGRLVRADAPRDRLWLPPTGRSCLGASAQFHVSVSRRVNLQTGAISRSFVAEENDARARRRKSSQMRRG